MYSIIQPTNVHLYFAIIVIFGSDILFGNIGEKSWQNLNNFQQLVTH